MVKSPAIITKVSTMSDGGVRVQVDTNEIPPDVAAELMSLNRQFGMFAFAPEGKPIEEADLNIPDEQKEFPEQKSLSLRLRNVIYILWEKKGKVGDFEAFRATHMERLINYVKQKIDEA